ncbi:hypothetical protein [Chondrinema litorale]|uniref:hypothetical protein n=1 Tax=Chondrinema litorale TaxID=2994555 RepID=UPI0025433247|nr:hypothetical protein [Chondrinema litorale]UZR94026.1 hypothetical protein OQ292_19475 [Chondrinema litorale]
MNIRFDASSETIIWITCLLLLFLFALIFIELKRKNKAYLAGRLSAIILIVLALFGMSLKPVLLKSSSADQALLITEGASDSLVSSLTESFNPDEIIDLRTKKNSGKLSDAVSIEKLKHFREMLDIYQSWLIAGIGLEDNLQAFLKGKNVKYFPEGFKEGVQQISFSNKTVAGSVWELKGTYYKSDTEPIKIFLEASGQKRDSVLLINTGFQTFTLNIDITESPGRYLFNLLEKTTDNKVSDTHEIPVLVEGPLKRKYLLLTGFPNFEWKYLKDYLSDRGDVVFYRSQISKEKYQTEVLNTDESAQVSINSQFLSDFDLIVLDNSAWENFSTRERNIVQTVTNENGVGLLLCTQGQGLPSNKYFTGFQPNLLSYQEKSISFGDSQLGVEISIDDLLSTIAPSSKLNPLLVNEEGKLLAVYAFDGYGKQAVLVLPALYPFILEGENEKFNRTYRYLIDHLQKETFKEKHWELSGIYPALKRKAVQLKLKTVDSDLEPESIESLVISPLADTTSLSPLQDYQISEDYNYTYWPVSTGWHKVYLEADTTVKDWFYVAEDTSWEVLQIASQIADNSFNLAWNTSTESNLQTLSTFNEWKIPVWYFFIILLIGLSSLWLISKL